MPQQYALQVDRYYNLNRHPLFQLNQWTNCLRIKIVTYYLGEKIFLFCKDYY